MAKQPEQVNPDEWLAESQLPQVREDVQNLNDPDFLYVPLDPGYQVAEYHPLPNGQGKPTEILFIASNQQLKIGFIMRLKSARAVNELIAALRRHRNSVWPV